MKNEKELLEEKLNLEEQLKKIKKELEILKKKVPDGAKLRGCLHGNTYQYYISTETTGRNGKYIKKENIKLAQQLAQIEYDEKLVKNIQRRIKHILDFQLKTKNDVYENAKERMHISKLELIDTHCITEEEYIYNWISQEYEGVEFKDNSNSYYTRKGLRVRSKSEALIAECLDMLEIPYLYEKPLTFSNGKVVHPDFTLLNIKDKTEVYWEHFGMMDDIEYRANAFNKIRMYELNKYFQGINFIYTWETTKMPLNNRSVKEMLEMLKPKLGYE
ncbi:MAG: hypothetical protein K6B67_04035 [Lachnospiraceae bacterium]|nr:hypothetical protein [Lachnospiraceae bacterium]